MKKLLFLITIFSVFWAFPIEITASNFSVSPEKIINNMFSTRPFKLKVFNSSDYQITLNIEPVVITNLNGEELEFTAMDPRTASRIAYPSEITVEANGVKEIEIPVIHNFTRPFNFGLVFSEELSQIQSATRTTGRILIPFLNSGKGRVLGISSGQNLFQLTTHQIYTTNIIDYDIEITNTSSENIIPLGVTSIKNKFGFINEVSKDYNADQRIILAESTRALGDTIELSGFNFGIATLKIDLLYGSSNTVYTLERDIFIVPVYMLLLPLGALVFTVFYIKRRKTYAKNNK